MACWVERMAWLDRAIVDGELDEFLVAAFAAHRDGTGLWSRPARRTADWISRKRPCPSQKNSLETGFASRRLHSGDDSHRGSFPLEFPLAPALPSPPRPLCRRSTRIVFAET